MKSIHFLNNKKAPVYRQGFFYSALDNVTEEQSAASPATGQSICRI